MYDRQVTIADELTFGVSGMLYQNGLIMFDRESDSLWSQVLGQSISGKFKDIKLHFIPALQTDWGTWFELHPETLVIEPQGVSIDSYDRYYQSNKAGILGTDQGSDSPLHIKEFVIGVRLDAQAKAYPFSVLSKELVVNDTLASKPLAVFFDLSSASGAVFSRELADGQVLQFQPGPNPELVLDEATQSTWQALTGEAIDGPLKGEKLEQIPITYAFWFGWADYHQETEVYLGQ